METDGRWARGGGLVVSVLAYYSNNLSSNPANVWIINYLQIDIVQIQFGACQNWKS